MFPERLAISVHVIGPSCSGQGVQLAWVPLDVRVPSRSPRANARQIVLHNSFHLHPFHHNWRC